MESKHNRLLEEKILLEDELASKQVLNEEIQRLKDEVRGETNRQCNLRGATADSFRPDAQIKPWKLCTSRLKWNKRHERDLNRFKPNRSRRWL